MFRIKKRKLINFFISIIVKKKSDIIFNLIFFFFSIFLFIQNGRTRRTWWTRWFGRYALRT
jgi:hypothetical protein